MTARTCLSIVLAAGLGTRMKSDMPKVLHQIGGLPMVGHVLKALEEAGSERVSVITGPDMPKLESLVHELMPTAHCHVQAERLGTAHATLAAKSDLQDAADDVVVIFGDTPLVTSGTISKVRGQLAEGADLVVLGFETPEPLGYGRLLIDDGRLVAIREERDASEEERKTTFCNSGIMGFSGAHALALMESVGNKNAKNEFYLTDAVEIANQRGLKVVAVAGSEVETQGINTRAQLASCEEDFQNRMRLAALENGCTLLAPHTVFFSHDTILETGVTVEQNVVFAPGVKVASGATIRALGEEKKKKKKKKKVLCVDTNGMRVHGSIRRCDVLMNTTLSLLASNTSMVDCSSAVRSALGVTTRGSANVPSSATCSKGRLCQTVMTRITATATDQTLSKKYRWFIENACSKLLIRTDYWSDSNGYRLKGIVILADLTASISALPHDDDAR